MFGSCLINYLLVLVDCYIIYWTTGNGYIVLAIVWFSMGFYVWFLVGYWLGFMLVIDWLLVGFYVWFLVGYWWGFV